MSSFLFLSCSHSIVFLLFPAQQHQDEQQKQKYQHSSTAPHTAPLISKKHFPFDVPSSPRSVQTIEKNEALFTFDKHCDSTLDDNHIRSGYENGGSKVIVDGNKVYYHGSSSYKSDNKISNGNGDTRYHHRHDRMTAHEKENTSDASATAMQQQRLQHMTDENYYDEQTYSSYSKYSRRDGPWKNRHGGSNKSNSSTKATKPYPSEYTAYKSSSTSNKKQFDDTMFPFDRASITYDANDSNAEWQKRPSYANNYYHDSPSPDCDYYEQFRSAPRKSNASNVSGGSGSSCDARVLKELAALSRKQSLKMSKYDLPPSPSSIKNDHNHKFKNHISESDAFNLPIAKPNGKTNSTSPDTTTNITTTIHNDTTSISIVSQSSNNSANERNPVSQFEQIASKFDKIPSKVPHDCKYCLRTTDRNRSFDPKFLPTP